MSMPSSAIAVFGLRKSFQDKLVLDGIDLDIKEGTIFSLLGPNGAGNPVTELRLLLPPGHSGGGVGRLAAVPCHAEEMIPHGYGPLGPDYEAGGDEPTPPGTAGNRGPRSLVGSGDGRKALHAYRSPLSSAARGGCEACHALGAWRARMRVAIWWSSARSGSVSADSTRRRVADQARRLHRLGRRTRHARAGRRAAPGPAHLAQPGAGRRCLAGEAAGCLPRIGGSAADTPGIGRMLRE
jgi:hypothetical protein